MAEYLVVAQIQCKCGTHITVRAVQSTYGGKKSEPCWNCNREVVLNGKQGYCDGAKAPTIIVSSELRKK